MPEKSAEVRALEEKVKRERDIEEAAAAAEHRESEIVFTISQISNIVMMYCTDNLGTVVGVTTGSDIMRFFAEKSIELEAQLRRAIASEFPDENPNKIPTAEQVQGRLAEDAAGIVPS